MTWTEAERRKLGEEGRWGKGAFYLCCCHTRGEVQNLSRSDMSSAQPRALHVATCTTRSFPYMYLSVPLATGSKYLVHRRAKRLHLSGRELEHGGTSKDEELGAADAQA